MNPRTLIAVAVLACCGCTTELGSAGRMREQLDEYVIDKPLARAWPEALRFLDHRGYAPVGADRKRAGLPEIGGWHEGANGAETQTSGRRWQADTAEDATGKRYRIIGVDLGADACRIGFFTLTPGGAAPQSDERNRVTMLRDPVTELAFIETFDPAGAAKMRPKDPGFF